MSEIPIPQAEKDGYYGQAALALVIALLRELHHEGLMDEARFKRLLFSTAGIMRALLQIRRDFKPIEDEDAEDIDFDALIQDMQMGEDWRKEQQIEAILKQVEERFFKLEDAAK
ncbi:hypothetical protein [Magnetospira sp. QH-2]|uniref:hypothetical protein n=1 Tax=Magnetospira sp. (strain QH-2) TaxID=1288970 RepID=UPI0003E81ACB|nr:hypothetical protein [Magnetospira sp. QH-2]CCQ75011.1 protein of unknown function [Magnetospira sp. QH-2]